MECAVCKGSLQPVNLGHVLRYVPKHVDDITGLDAIDPALAKGVLEAVQMVNYLVFGHIFELMS